MKQGNRPDRVQSLCYLGHYSAKMKPLVSTVGIEMFIAVLPGKFVDGEGEVLAW